MKKKNPANLDESSSSFKLGELTPHILIKRWNPNHTQIASAHKTRQGLNT